VIAKQLNKLRFKMAVRRVLDTPPLVTSADGPTVLSMVHHRDVLPYLLAIKSFVRHVPSSRIVVIADPTITAFDRTVLSQHIPALDLRDAVTYRCAQLPTGGTWERLIAIADEVSRNYTIQLDADTVTSAPLPEVAEATRNNRPFLLCTANGQTILSCAEVSAIAKAEPLDEVHIQLLCEALLDKLEGPRQWRYVKACSAFAGFPLGSLDRNLLIEVSERMESIVGNRWREWGSEQVASNLILASMNRALLLPHPKYAMPHWANADTAFRHFIGYVRFASPLYAQMATAVSHELANAH
jgi:hypothetical protein